MIRRNWLSLILSGAIIYLLLNLALDPKGPRYLAEMRRRHGALEANRLALISENDRLKTIVQNERSNDRYLEHLIRRELGYARPDELVYRFAGEAVNDR
ncbi:MAG TPA: septum formation initiator family protein [Candidatus Binataceae bacterium]|nr:septum formation initiator family protein [Candidatus Binataceae bacterium]